MDKNDDQQQQQEFNEQRSAQELRHQQVHPNQQEFVQYGGWQGSGIHMNMLPFNPLQ